MLIKQFAVKLDGTIRLETFFYYLKKLKVLGIGEEKRERFREDGRRKRKGQMEYVKKISIVTM